jgi:hypothetical protein
VPEYSAADLGPLIEMVQLARTGILPPPNLAPWLRLNGSEAILHAAAGNAGIWTSPNEGCTGIFRCSTMETDLTRWTSFKLDAHKAALAMGFSAQTVRRLMGAMGEIVDNVLEHSQAASTGFVAFKGQSGSFEFTIADAGVGILASLRSNSEYAYLSDEGDALQCALTEGESRYGKAAKRGTGFSTLFRSLVSLNASLRFRSGDHALTMSGTSPTLVNALVARKPRASGFMISVHCTL